VITCMNARDRLTGSDRRIKHMLDQQPAMKYEDHWTYVGKGGVSMLTACFTMK
jgi:hypothetical protein